MTRSRLAIWTLGWVILLTGCQDPLRPGLLDDASVYFDRGEYSQAYAAAWAVAQRGEPDQRAQAALVAGLAARQQGRDQQAHEALTLAAKRGDDAVAGDALASLGLMYAQQERYAMSADALLEAAERLEGQPRANAYFYAAVAQQKLGRRAQARTNLLLARAASDDPAFIAQVTDQLDVVGWTLQLGAFHDADNARQVADAVADQARDAGLGSPRIVERVDRHGQPLAVVQVGQFTTFQSASAARDRLGRNSAIITSLAGQ